MSKQDKENAPEKTPGTIWIGSFDIGKVNFCWYIEEIDPRDLADIKPIPENQRYYPDGTPTPDMQNLLDQVCMHGKTILHTNSDLTKNCVKSKYLDPEVFHNLTNLLDKYSNYWDKCSYFIVEMQMAFRGKYNTMALKIGQHCYSYFNICYGRFKQVLEFPAYYKTTVLGAQKIKGKRYKNGKTRWKTIDKPARKKWCVAKATEILGYRGEEHILNNLKTKKKRDDLADTLCQCQSWKVLHFIHKTL